jgi:hypothetical protein
VEEVVDIEGMKVGLAELDLPALGFPLQIRDLIGALSFADEVQIDAFGLASYERPIGVVIVNAGPKQQHPRVENSNT